MPGLFLTLTYILGFRSVNFVSLIGITASATGVSSFTMAQQGNADAELAGDIVVLSNALCPITIFLWSFIFKSIGAF